MTVPIPVTSTTITTAWGTAVATDVNGLLTRTTAVEAWNAGVRLGTAEANIVTLIANDARMGASITVASILSISPGGTVQFGTTVDSAGVTVATDYIEILTAGVYAVKTGVNANVGATGYMSIHGGSSTLSTGTRATGSPWSYDSWMGLVNPGTRINVKLLGGAAANVVAGYLNVYRVSI